MKIHLADTTFPLFCCFYETPNFPAHWSPETSWFIAFNQVSLYFDYIGCWYVAGSERSLAQLVGRAGGGVEWALVEQGVDSWPVVVVARRHVRVLNRVHPSCNISS